MSGHQGCSNKWNSHRLDIWENFCPLHEVCILKNFFFYLNFTFYTLIFYVL